MKKEINGVTFYDEFAEAAEKVTPEEWAFVEYCGDISNQIYDLMEAQSVSKADLARMLKKSRSFVTKVLRGDANLTFKTFTALLVALDAKPVTKLVHKELPCTGNNIIVPIKGGKQKDYQILKTEQWGEPVNIDTIDCNTACETVETVDNRQFAA